MIGDYVAGTNHVLPTGGTARFAARSALPTSKSTFTSCAPTPARWPVSAPRRRAIAEAEGLFAHADSIRRREEPV